MTSQIDPTEASAAESPRSPTIVVGYSSKAEGRAALDRALAEARLRQAQLFVVNTSPDGDLTALRTELSESGVGFELHDVGEAIDPAEELLTAADSTGADFIVIGLRRRSPVGKLLLGSNAQRILLDAACPVLAVKAEVT